MNFGFLADPSARPFNCEPPRYAPIIEGRWTAEEREAVAVLLPHLTSGNPWTLRRNAEGDPAMRFSAKRSTWETWIFAPTAAGLVEAIEAHIRA